MKIQINDRFVDCSDDFSQKNFTGRSVDVSDGATVYGSCFSQETPDAEVFRSDMKNVTFINCNLDNVFIPDNNTIIGGSMRRFKAQNDLNDWLIDDTDKPTLPLNHKAFTKFDLPMPDPLDIPAQKQINPIDLLQVAKESK